MTKILGAVLLLVLLPSLGAAEVRSIKVCDSKTLTANTTTDCTYTDISQCQFLSYQIYCNETDPNSMDISVDWVEGSACGSAYMAIPILSSGSALGQLKTNYTTESAWSAIQSLTVPVAPCGTIRFTENNNDADIICTAIVNCGF